MAATACLSYVLRRRQSDGEGTYAHALVRGLNADVKALAPEGCLLSKAVGALERGPAANLQDRVLG